MLKSMISLKKDSKKFLNNSYFKIILPLIIFMVSNCVTYLIWNYFMLGSELFGNDLLIFLCLISIVILQFVICPVTIIWFYKTYLLISIDKNKNTFGALSFLKGKNVFRNILMLNFIPALLNIFILIFSNGNIIYYTQNSILLTICCVIKIIVDYKLFICNYYFTLSGKGAKTCFKISCKFMKRKINHFLFFYVSFIGWIVFSVFLFYIFKGIGLGDMFSVKMLFNYKIYTPFLKSASAFLWGVGFYLYPYLLITKAKYCNKILGDTVF